MSNLGWVGVDFDGTLAKYDGWKGADQLGEPIPEMVARVKAWISQGIEVRIFTARIYPIGTSEYDADDQRSRDATLAYAAIFVWCREHIGRILPVTCVKDYGMVELWDDRAVQVVKNTGRAVDGRG